MAINTYVIKKAYPRNHSDKYNEIEIKGKNLFYAELQHTHSGCQTNNSENNDLIHEKCRQISKLIKEIDELNN